MSCACDWKDYTVAKLTMHVKYTCMHAVASAFLFSSSIIPRKALVTACTHVCISHAWLTSLQCRISESLLAISYIKSPPQHNYSFF